MSERKYNATRFSVRKKICCDECGDEIEEKSKCIMHDGELLCEKCLNAFAKDDISSFIEWLGVPMIYGFQVPSQKAVIDERDYKEYGIAGGSLAEMRRDFYGFS